MKQLEQAEIKRLSDKLEVLKRKAQPLLANGQLTELGEVVQEQQEIEGALVKLRELRDSKLSKEAQKLQKLPFSRVITKKEQADMGALKKRVKGLVVIHPMTALGREMGLQDMTGFASKDF